MDLYAVLGLAPTADQAAIRNAYRSLAKRYHPDVSDLPDAHARFVAIAEAYQVLNDPATRARYDRTRQRAASRQARPQRPAATPRATSSRPRYDRAYSRQRHRARARAEAHSRMPYEEFNVYAFDTVVDYMGPKILGCAGFAVIALAVMALMIWAVSRIEWLVVPVAVV
ncbi:MAG: J domain-containing protein, partial [Flavobacteriales bacterium]|nr:J domain-containing protein [Flavobacteriales bacterium]